MRFLVWICACLLLLVVQGEAQLAKFEPPAGKIYHGVGQPPFGIQEYLAAMEDSSLLPLVHKVYFDIPGSRPDMYNELRSILAGHKAAGRFPELSIGFQDGTKATDSLIAASTLYDATIDSIATVCKQYHARLLVRPGFEFNGPWFGYKPYLYVAAFQKVVDRFRSSGAADSIAFQWCYYPSGAAADFDSVDAMGPRWYPGDDYVDWFGLDLFYSSDFDMSLPLTAMSGQLTSRGKSEKFLAMARARNKPVFLSETSPVNIATTADPADGINDWNAWFKPFFEFIEAHSEIKGFNYINWNWSAIPSYASMGWKDARIENNAYILTTYKNELRKPPYLHLKGSQVTALNQPEDVPSAFMLFQNYPNPFNPVTTLRFSSPGSEKIFLSIYNVLGQKVATVWEGEITEGTHAVVFDGSDLPSGVYFYRLQSDNRVLQKTMTILK